MLDHTNIYTIGVDEAGRGSLAFDVVAAAVIMPASNDPMMHKIKDSKKMTKKAREIVAEYIKQNAITYGIGTASPAEIDDMNILQATYLAMHRALDMAYAKHSFEQIHVDGNRFKPYKCIPHECIVSGDNQILNIAAASILAKTHHDNSIHDILKNDPNMEDHWNFASNVGYGTKKHMDAIKQFGISEYHRKTFIH